MLTFLAIYVIKKVDAVFYDTVAHIAEVTTHIHIKTLLTTHLKITIQPEIQLL